MSETVNLALPILEAAQAQKHVTHNEALRVLDGVVQIGVASRNVNAPPGSPADGARYLIGAAPTGAFAGQAGKIALREDAAWRFLTPRAGWIAFVAAESAVIVFDGTSWKNIGEIIASLANLTGLGVGTAPDATNVFAAKLNASLFTAKSFGEGGTGDLRVTFNKSASGNTLSHLYQVNFSGRAETGLTGDEKWRLRVSADGAAWRDAIVADPAANTLGLYTNNIERVRLDASGHLRPVADNAYTLGASGARWASVWAANGVIQTSDARQKTDVEDSALGLDFILGLRPVSYRWIIGSHEEQADGGFEARPGQRRHFGLLAQQVRQTLDKLGIGDFGGYVKTDRADPQSGEGLRYDQFIAPLIGAVQTLARELDDLKRKLS